MRVSIDGRGWFFARNCSIYIHAILGLESAYLEEMLALSVALL